MVNAVSRLFRRSFFRALALLFLLTLLPRVQAQSGGTVLADISTRLNVQTGENVLIAGFIVRGTQPKKVLVRGIGPSLTSNGTPVPGRLANPTITLNGPNGEIAKNDDWRSRQESEIMATNAAPKDDLESAIVATLPASSSGTGYTLVLSGVNNETGIGLVEVFDIDRSVDSQLANVSTRGFVQTGDNAMIGGVIVLGSGSQKVLVRAIGPSLANANPPVASPLADPTLQVFNSNGAIVASNDDWKSTQKTEIEATGVAPKNDAESAIIATLPGSNSGIGYTAVVRGKNNGAGVALVEVYALANTVAASPKLFIANGGDATPANSSVTTANLDGTGGKSLGNIGGFLNTPEGIAVDSTNAKIYVGNESGNTITKSNLDGSGAVNLSLAGLLNGPYGVALDVAANKMYVANGGGQSGIGFVVRADLDGSNATRLTNLDPVLSKEQYPQGIAIDPSAGKIYVAVYSAKIIQANLDGTGGTALTFGGLLTGTAPLDVAVNPAGNRIYVADFNGQLFSADLNGNNATNLGNLNGTLKSPRGLGLDVAGGKIYVSNSANNTVTRADLPNATNPVVLTIATLNAPAVIGVYRP